jgi:DNA-binding ferritin-like protein
MGSTSASAKVSVEQVLTHLQESIRRTQRGSEADQVTTKRLPMELTNGQATYLMLTSNDRELLEIAQDALIADLRFEHLQNVEKHLWTFAARAWLTR